MTGVALDFTRASALGAVNLVFHLPTNITAQSLVLRLAVGALGVILGAGLSYLAAPIAVRAFNDARALAIRTFLDTFTLARRAMDVHPIIELSYHSLRVIFVNKFGEFSPVLLSKIFKFRTKVENFGVLSIFLCLIFF